MLKYISDKGYIKVDEISQQFGVPKSFVEHVFQELLRKEYIRVLHSEDEKITCASCLLKNVCYRGSKRHQILCAHGERGKNY
jgi:DNA-binding MarR family transcriptional regulator